MRKRFYLPLLFMALLTLSRAHAQADTACKLITETDPFTREVKMSTGFIGLDGASVTLDADSKEIIFLISMEGAEKCFDNNSTIELYFEGLKSKTMSRNAGTMNCEGLLQLVFKNTQNTPTTILNRLCTMKATHFIITGNSKKPVTVNLGPKERESLQWLANCLVTQGRTLIR